MRNELFKDYYGWRLMSNHNNEGEGVIFSKNL
jgi:hypothetical protein